MRKSDCENNFTLMIHAVLIGKIKIINFLKRGLFFDKSYIVEQSTN